MNLLIILKTIGTVLRIEGALMLPPLCIALFRGETAAAVAFCITMAAVECAGLLLLLARPKDKHFFAKDGFVTVSLSWIILSLFGCLPFFLSGAIPYFIDAFFETVSGFTTTGASILSDVEALPMSLLYWRSFTHWLGGMGVLVFLMAVVPLSGEDGGSLLVLRAESPGPTFGKFVPRLRYTARILYAIYIALTVLLFLLLLAGGMPLFDSVCNAFATAGTGGFSVRTAGIGSYDSVYLQAVLSIFMILFGVNFNIYYCILLGEFREIFRSEELRLYLGVIAASTALITWNVRSFFPSLFQAFHHSLFTVSSIITTTGYATADFDLWPQLSRCILLLLMVVGASAGSTGGGIKMARVLILCKTLKSTLQKMLHPRAVKLIKLEGKVVDDAVIAECGVFITAYLLIACASWLLIAFLDNMSLDGTVSAVLACLNNIGPGLSEVGPTSSFGALTPLSKIVLTCDMLIGRLEIFPVLMLFSPNVWKRGR